MTVPEKAKDLRERYLTNDHAIKCVDDILEALDHVIMHQADTDGFLLDSINYFKNVKKALGGEEEE